VRAATHKALHIIKPKLAYHKYSSIDQLWQMEPHAISVTIPYIHGITRVIIFPNIHIFAEFDPKALF